MAKYKIIWERRQRGKKLDYKREEEIESNREPKVGEGKILLVDPPIHEYISKVEKLVSSSNVIPDVSTRFVIANETISDIVKGKKYELIETESMGYYIIDDTGEETYYHNSVLDV